MTNSQQIAYSHKWHRFQQKYEKMFTAEFKKALQIQVKAYIKTQDILVVPSFPIYEVLSKLYKKVSVAWVNELRFDRIKALGQMAFNERIVELMRQYYNIDLLNDAELMTSYSREIIVRVLSEAAQSGKSFVEITQLLLNHPEFNKMRAMRIARTETVTAANGAAMIHAKDSGLKMDKTWIAISDRRTRHSHAGVSTEPIPYENPFIVGGSFMMYPGARDQTNGLATPAKEIVNCRCTIAFTPKRDSNGRLIRI